MYEITKKEIRTWDTAPGTPKLAVGFISNGWGVTLQFCLSLLMFAEYDYSPDGPHVLQRNIAAGGLYVDDNRNKLTDMFLKDSRDLDYLLMVDSDIEFTPSVVYKMLECADPVTRPVISALYFTNFTNEDLGVQPLWYIEKEKNLFSHFLKPINLDGNVLHEIDACGAGCMLVHRSVFEKIAEIHSAENYKWFKHLEVHPDSTPVGEDLVFCQRIREAGFKIYGLGMVVDHCKMGRQNVLTYMKDHPDYVTNVPTDPFKDVPTTINDKVVQLKKVA